MTDHTVRLITDDESADYIRCMGTGFHFGREVTDERIEFFHAHFLDTVRKFLD